MGHWLEEFYRANPAHRSSALKGEKGQVLSTNSPKTRRQSRAWMALPCLLSFLLLPPVCCSQRTCYHQVFLVLSGTKSLGYLHLQHFKDVALNSRRRVVWWQHFADYASQIKEVETLNLYRGKTEWKFMWQRKLASAADAKSLQENFSREGHKNLL